MPQPKAAIHRFDLIIQKDLLKRCLLDVQNFTTQWKYSLCLAVTGCLNSTARRISLNDIDLAFFRLTGGAGGKLALCVDIVELF